MPGPPENRDRRGLRVPREPPDRQDLKDLQGIRDRREPRDRQGLKGRREPRVRREPLDQRDLMDQRDLKDRQGLRDLREPLDRQDRKGRRDPEDLRLPPTASAPWMKTRSKVSWNCFWNFLCWKDCLAGISWSSQSLTLVQTFSRMRRPYQRGTKWKITRGTS